jgi:homoserine kinase
MKNWQLYVKVPGTSANLGSGFDILGLALTIYNEFYFSFGENLSYSLSLKNGNPIPFKTEENLIKTAYLKYAEKFLSGVKIIPFDVSMKLDLPLKGGLGSSASALVAGFAAANYIHKKFHKDIELPSEKKILFELAMMEGHPDNTTPAYLGGFIFAYFDNDKLVYFKKKFPKKISLFILIPEMQIETNHSRKKLPETYSTDDVIFNMSRVGTWIEFVESGKFSQLQRAVEDRIHTPYRIEHLPFFQKTCAIIKELGATFSLSGSGPTLLIYIPKSKQSDFFSQLKKRLSEVKEDIKLSYQILPIEPSNKGLVVHEEKVNHAM